MPLPIAHSLLGASFVALIYPKTKEKLLIPLGLGAFLANAADFDFALVILFGSKEWHRGFSHSILFSVCVFFTVFALTRFNKLRESAAFGFAFASHLILDFITTKIGDGLELFWFFKPERYGLGLFGLSEKPSQLSVPEIIGTILLEFLIFSPILILLLYFRKKMR